MTKHYPDELSTQAKLSLQFFEDISTTKKITHYPDKFLTQAKEELKLSLQFLEEKYNLTEKADSNFVNLFFNQNQKIADDKIEKILSYTIDFLPANSEDEVDFIFYAKIDRKKLNDLRARFRKNSERELFRAIMDFGLNRLHHRILYLTLSLYYRQKVVAIGLDHSPVYIPFILFLESELGKRLAEYHNFNALKKITSDVNSLFLRSRFPKAKASFEQRMFCFLDPTTNVLSKQRMVLNPSMLFLESFLFDLVEKKSREISSYSLRFTLPGEVFNTVFNFDLHFETCMKKTPWTPEAIETLQKFFRTNRSLLAMPFVIEHV